MNKVYKVVWNDATQNWVAVAELSRARGKSKTDKALKIAVCALVAGGVANASAAEVKLGGGATHGRENIAIGGSSNAGPGWVGEQNETFQSSIAVGFSSSARGPASVAIGVRSSAGDNSRQNNYATAVGAESGATRHSSVALGAYAKATAVRAIAIGRETAASAEKAVALGESAQASKENAVAIGSGATTDQGAAATSNVTVNSIRYGNFAAGSVSDGMLVSFGKAGSERQLKHIASGMVAAHSTDAVNGSQLYAVANTLGNLAHSVKDALGGNSAVGTDGKISLPTYAVFKGKPANQTGNGTAKFGNDARNVGAALTNLNEYVNQGIAVKNNAGANQGILTPGESIQFSNGNATTAVVTSEANIKYDVNVDN